MSFTLLNFLSLSLLHIMFNASAHSSYIYAGNVNTTIIGFESVYFYVSSLPLQRRFYALKIPNSVTHDSGNDETKLWLFDWIRVCERHPDKYHIRIYI